MGRTTIQVSDELADELHSRKERGDSYEDVVWRLIDRAEGGEVSDSPSRGARERPRETDSDAPLTALSFPGGVDHDEAVEAILAARDYLREQGAASMKEIVSSVGPEYPLKYDPPESFEPGERYRGAWWRRVVKPGLEALDDVEAPNSDEGETDWAYAGGDR
ncbi:MAG: hypothetical protein ABEJ85_03170 [Haloarculaceae archaeon]